MGSANMTEQEKVMRYPPSIIAWEMKHGIVRYEKNGMMYIAGIRPHEEICESILKERVQLQEQEKRKQRGEAL